MMSSAPASRVASQALTHARASPGTPPLRARTARTIQPISVQSHQRSMPTRRTMFLPGAAADQAVRQEQGGADERRAGRNGQRRQQGSGAR